MLRGDARLRWSNGVGLLALYLAAMLVSLLATGTIAAAAPKLASQLYLLSLPILVDTLTDDLDDLKRLFLAWLAGTSVTALVGTAAVVMFFAGVDRSTIDFALHNFGTLPPGNYPRLESTFAYPAMLCNYLTVSLALLLLCLHLRWIGRRAGYALLGAILLTAAFTITPGLGGIGLILGAWIFAILKARARAVAVIGLASSVLLAVAFVAVAVIAPVFDPGAPFFIALPGIEAPFAPSVRAMAWSEAVAAFVAQPLFGSGLGSAAIAVPYVAPSGDAQVLTDAHNVFLNVAMYCGVVGLATILLLVGFVTRQMRPWGVRQSNLIPFALGFAWLNAFAYQGLTGSYEDARHLWLLFGLLLASLRTRQSPTGEQTA